MLTKIVVADHQVGVLTKGSEILALLRAGTSWHFNPLGKLKVEYFDLRDAFFVSDWADLLMKKFPSEAERLLDVVETGADEVALISVDGKPAYRMHPFETAYVWKALAPVTVERFDICGDLKTTRAVADRFGQASLVSRLEEAHGQAIRIKAALSLTKSISRTVVESHAAGVVFIDGAYVEALGPGEHFYWNVSRKVDIKLVDMRPTPLEIAAQEILTKDKVSLRLTLTSFVTVTDAAKALLATPDYSQHIYRLAQFAVREAVAGRTLAEVLADRTAVDAEINAGLANTLGDIGVRVDKLGIRDVILPGEMRALMNRVVEAEKLAEANIIRRREETAATRSLLNTAKLMEASPMLLRLKELEALERVTEKIGHIDVHASEGKGLNALVDSLVSLKGSEA